MTALLTELSDRYTRSFSQDGITLFQIPHVRVNPIAYAPRNVHKQWPDALPPQRVKAGTNFGRRVHLGLCPSTRPKAILLTRGSVLLRWAPAHVPRNSELGSACATLLREQQHRLVEAGTLIVIEHLTYYELIANSDDVMLYELIHQRSDVDTLDVVQLKG